MKEDKETKQPILESIWIGESKISSMALALRQFTKESEKKEAAEEDAKVRCKTCFKEIAPKRLCSGHGGGSGGGGGDSVSSDKTSEKKVSSSEERFLTKPEKVVGTTDEMISEFSSEELDFESSFDPHIIAELIAKGLLLINSDRKSMTLTIKLQCEPRKLTEEQREELKKFMEAITKELNEFKEENHLSDDCVDIAQDEEGYILSLRINMPTLILYDAFIQRLANNLVPTAQEKNEVIKDQHITPNLLSIEPKPPSSTAGERIEKNEEEQEFFNPSPFTIQP